MSTIIIIILLVLLIWNVKNGFEMIDERLKDIHSLLKSDDKIDNE